MATELEIDAALEGLDYDPEGKALLIGLMIEFERIFGFTPSRKQFLAYMARADELAAEHIKALNDRTKD